MEIDGLPIPPELIALIESGRWPVNKAIAEHQNLRPLITKETIHRIAPEEESLFIYPPPFTTGATHPGLEGLNWNGLPDEIMPPGDIDFNNAIIIADFGLGSDAGIALDYRNNPLSPSVIRYRWSPQGKEFNRWVRVAPSFKIFAEMIGL